MEDKKEQVQPVAPVLPNVALGIFKDKDGWKACKIRYNPATGETGKFEPVGHGNEKLIAIERFKILAVEEKLVT